MGNVEQSIYRAVGAFAGLISSLIFPWLMTKFSLPMMGMIGIFSQLACLMIMSMARYIVPAMFGWEAHGNDSTLAVFAFFLAVSRSHA